MFSEKKNKKKVHLFWITSGFSVAIPYHNHLAIWSDKGTEMKSFIL